MKKVILTTLIALIAVPAFAATQGDATAAWALYIGAGVAISFAGLGAGIRMGSAIRGGLEGISRNPGVAGTIFNYLLVGVALIESIAIYGLVVSLILLFVK